MENMFNPMSHSTLRSGVAASRIDVPSSFMRRPVGMYHEASAYQPMCYDLMEGDNGKTVDSHEVRKSLREKIL